MRRRRRREERLGMFGPPHAEKRTERWNQANLRP